MCILTYALTSEYIYGARLRRYKTLLRTTVYIQSSFFYTYVSVAVTNECD
jgi:hypothetical protein